MLRRGPFVLRVAGFVALCLWASSGWIWAEALPARMGSVAGQGFHFLLIGLAMTAWSLLSSKKLPEFGLTGRIALAGLALFAAPVLLLHTAQGMVSSSLGVVVFALLPVAVLVMAGWMKGLAPALLGVAGVLLLLPVSLPEGRGLAGVGLMLLAMVLTAGSMVGLHRLLPQGRWAGAVAAICLANGTILTLAGWSQAAWSVQAARDEGLRALVVDGPEVLLLLWLLGALEPRQLAARWLIAPLFTVVEGYLLMRPEAGLRLLSGVVLLAAGGWWLFAQKGEEHGAEGLGLSRL